MLRQRHSTVYAIKNFLDRGNFTLFGTVNEFACNDAKAFSQFAIRLPRLPVQFEKQRVARMSLSGFPPLEGFFRAAKFSSHPIVLNTILFNCIANEHTREEGRAIADVEDCRKP